MTGDPLTALDRLGLLFRAITAAIEYGYSLPSSAGAVAELLDDVDRGDVVMVASLLAGLLATDLRPRTGASLEAWATAYAVELLGRERES